MPTAPHFKRLRSYDLTPRNYQKPDSAHAFLDDRTGRHLTCSPDTVPTVSASDLRDVSDAKEEALSAWDVRLERAYQRLSKSSAAAQATSDGDGRARGAGFCRVD